MMPVLAELLAAFALELAKAAGHETGIELVAAAGKLIPPHVAAEVWAALVKHAEAIVAQSTKHPEVAEIWPVPGTNLVTGPPEYSGG